MKMNGEEVCYPAFLLGGPDVKPLAFTGPSALFISGRFRPPVGPMTQAILVDGSGRSWTLHAVTAIGRWGTWKEQLLLWWRRQYRVEYDATEGPAMSLDELKSILLQKASASETALSLDTEIDDQIRQYFLEGWSKAREELTAAGTFQAVAEAMGPYRLYADNWFSGRGRSNRAEYLAVLLSAIVIPVMAGLLFSIIPSIPGLIVDIVLGTVIPVWLIGAAAARRTHDFGWAFSSIVVLWVAISFAEIGAQKYLHFKGDPHGWLAVVALFLLILALAIPPGASDENRYDPRPNPGPSL